MTATGAPRHRHEAAADAGQLARLEVMNRVLLRLAGGGTAAEIAGGFLDECTTLFPYDYAAVLGGSPEQGPLRELAARVRGRTEHGASRPGPVTMRSSLEVPLLVAGRETGVVRFQAGAADLFSTGDMATLYRLAGPLAATLESARVLSSLTESELMYRSLVAQADEMIILVDGSTLRILEANDHTTRVLGYSREELLEMTVDGLADAPLEDVRRDVDAVIEHGELRLAERGYRRKDGTRVDVDVLVSLVTYGGREAVLALVRDVSERRAMQAQLMQSQKMESLGLMAGNLAHDFNNLLTTILGFAGLLKLSTNLPYEERENLGLIEDAARQAADLTGRLLAFARGGLVRFGPVDLRAVVNDTLQLAAPALHGKLEVTTNLPEHPVTVEGDASQLQQALLNILLNARDATAGDGAISIDLECGAGLARATIRDDGSGMTEETRTRIFEPFYTTKPPGSGTGLGMAIAYGIVQGHHGDIAVESEPGVGTTFTLTLPLLANDAAAPAGGHYSPGDGNLVLVVDDDAMVRRTTAATLASLGYNVVEAPGGRTAVQVMEARPDRIAAVLLDLVMPGMTGSETFRALTALRADLPVIICTGYAADAHIDTDVKRRIAGLVQKPFTAERLARALTEAGVRGALSGEH